MRLKNPIPYIYYVLFGTLPLIFMGVTSEIFEFNKIIFLYIITISIVFFWLIDIITKKRIVFKKSIIDIPLLIFLLSQLVSTAISTDPHTSLLGYYSRFNGGFVSNFSYSILFWAFVTFVNKKHTKIIIKIILSSALVVSILAILERFGISVTCMFLTGETSTSCWAQKVTQRVFSTLGQPNWLAAYLVAIVPLSWWMHSFEKRRLFYLIVFSIFLIAIIFAGSRSGIISYFVALSLFVILSLIKKTKRIKEVGSIIIITVATLLLVGTPWTSGVAMQNNSLEINQDSQQTIDTSLENGGTESGEIRKIVWAGAIDIFRNHVLFGTGPETFANVYYKVRPVEHNLTSEWNYVYNKAHNEYLNYLATTGFVGLASYMTLVGTILLLLLSKIFQIRLPNNFSSPTILSRSPKSIMLSICVLAGFSGLLISNFFGFSVATTSVFLLLLPAFSITYNNDKKLNPINTSHLETSQKSYIFVTALSTFFLLFSVIRYWHGDTIYKRALDLKATNITLAMDYFEKATQISPNESLYWIELAETQSISATSIKDKAAGLHLAKAAVENAEIAQRLSPNNVSTIRRKYFIYDELSKINPDYLISARNELVRAAKLAPTDPKLFLSLGINYTKLDLEDNAITAFKHAIFLKPDYEKPRLALAYIYVDKDDYGAALEQTEYILMNINPQNTDAINLKKYLIE